ncbi:Mu-like prophage major head subunit gpT family protein [Nitratidesulfovibrio liaohensis]|uniref:Mu-like prophage major head subunit gpT family protein n=1 Tax=Nitratidesulfovibrio liaohensis TaxID=2604158 RepID=UPI001420BF4A|nr:Mu-like prophage major head subunit gpT family protein [Nitratidesulfovibrio liaohensis]NHZ48594.1 hypothetical protein [Nitratidesulfovibrio liaohensis]
MHINAQSLQAAFTGFKLIYQQAFAGVTPDHERIAMVVNSSTKQETYPFLGKTTGFREWVGDRVVQNLKSHDFTIKNKSFENTVGVDRDDFEDDTLGIYSPIFAQLGQDAAEHPSQLVYGLLASGFTGRCYDGQYFFDIDHPVLDESGNEISVSNFGGGTGTAWYLLDVTRAIKPLIFQKRRDYTLARMDQPTDEAVFTRKEYRYGVDARVNAGFGLWQLAYASKQELTTANYAAAREAMQGMKGDKGRPLGVKASLLVVPATLEQQALEVVKRERDASGATNVYQNSADILVSPWL